MFHLGRKGLRKENRGIPEILVTPLNVASQWEAHNKKFSPGVRGGGQSSTEVIQREIDALTSLSYNHPPTSTCCHVTTSRVLVPVQLNVAESV